MKKQPALLSPFLTTALATSAFTQPGGGGDGGGKPNWSNRNSTKEQETEDVSNAQLVDLTSKLTLTGPQKAAVKSTLDAQLAAPKKEKLPRDETKDKSKALKEAACDKIRTLLTPTQQKIFDKSFKKSGKKEKEKRSIGSSPRPNTGRYSSPARVILAVARAPEGVVALQFHRNTAVSQPKSTGELDQMKKHLVLSAAILATALMASTAFAQVTTTSAATTPATATNPAKKAKGSGSAAAAKADRELAELTQTLTLTNDQQAKIKPILADEASKIHGGMKAATGPDADAAKARNKAIRDDANKRINALLTPDQQKLFAESSKKEGSKKSAPVAPSAS